MTYIVVDIETVPMDQELHAKQTEDERKKLLNPIDSRIVAIGMKRHGKEPIVLIGGDEAELLAGFWAEIAKNKNTPTKIVGFNIKEFDIPFIVTRSFIKNVEIVPFLLKEIVEIREKLAAYKYGQTRGKLKEYASLLNIEIIDGMDGSQVADYYWKGDLKTIETYLRKDLEITEALYARMMRLKIDKIERW